MDPELARPFPTAVTSEVACRARTASCKSQFRSDVTTFLMQTDNISRL